MDYELEKAERDAYSDLAEINRHMANPKNKANPQVHSMLMEARRTAISTIKDIDEKKRMANADYRNTNIGYGTSDYKSDETNRMMNKVMRAINKLLPQIVNDDYSDDTDYNDDTEMRRGVPGTGKGRSRRARRAEMDYRRSDYSDYSDDDTYDDSDDDTEMRRGGARRRDSKGRFTKSEADADRQAERMMTAYQNGYNDAKRYSDTSTSTIYPYPHTPVMPRQDDRRSDNRNDTGTNRADTRSDADDNIHDTGRNATVRR